LRGFLEILWTIRLFPDGHSPLAGVCRQIERASTRQKKKRILPTILISLILFSAEGMRAQSVRVTTVVAFNPAATHSGTAGLDLNNPYTNAMGDYRLRMRGGGWGSTWHVDVRITRPAGDPSFVLEVQRDPANNQVRDGASWVTIGTANTYFFRSNGNTNVNALNIQYRLSNVTAGDPNIHTGVFPITVTYTIVHSLTHPP
jgi:hypothetical protein